MDEDKFNKQYLYKCLEGCNISVKLGCDLRYHLRSVHNIKINEKQRKFDNIEGKRYWFLNITSIFNKN